MMQEHLRFQVQPSSTSRLILTRFGNLLIHSRQAFRLVPESMIEQNDFAIDQFIANAAR